jgi:FKBP-type peptidyl-prolyl cis-trans isomerase FkpA
MIIIKMSVKQVKDRNKIRTSLNRCITYKCHSCIRLGLQFENQYIINSFIARSCKYLFTMNKFFKYLFAIIIFLPMCSLAQTSTTPEGYEAGPGGMLYKIYTHNNGPKIQVGNFIKVNAVGKTDGDSVLFSTYDSHPILTVVPKSPFKGDVFTGMQYLSEGDSATIKVLADSAFKVQTKPKGFKGKYLTYDVKVDRVIEKGLLTDSAFQEVIKTYLVDEGQKLRAQEPGKISRYISGHNLKLTRTADSLFYVINKPGIGAKIAPGDTVIMNYTGKLFNGKVFDSSIKEEVVRSKMPVDPTRQYIPAHIVVDSKSIIRGWYEGLQLLNKGASATFIVPSKLAYGKSGVSIIAPYTPIVFEITVINVRHAAKKPIQAPTKKVIKKGSHN